MSAGQDCAAEAARYLRAAVGRGRDGTVEDCRVSPRSGEDPVRVLLALTGIGYALLADIELRSAQPPAPLPPQRRRLFRRNTGGR